MSNKTLTADRIAEIKTRPIDLSDIRELTEEDFSRGHFRNNVEVKIAMDARLLEKFNATGLDLEAYINSSGARQWQDKIAEQQ